MKIHSAVGAVLCLIAICGQAADVVWTGSSGPDESGAYRF